VVGSDRRGPVSRPASVGFTAGVVVSADAIVHLTEYRDALTFYLFCGAIGPIEAAAFCPSSAAPPAEPVSGMGSGVGLTPCEDLGWEALCSGVPAEAVAVIRWSGAYYHVPILGVRSDLGFTPADLFRPRLGPQCRLAKGDYLHFTRASNSWMLNGRPVVETTPLLAPARIPRGRGLD